MLGDGEKLVNAKVIVVCEFAKMIITLGVLLYASVLDIRTREIEPRLWLFSGMVLFAIMLLEEAVCFSKGDVLRLALGTLIILVAVGGLYYSGLIGGGDLFSLIVISTSHQWNPFSVVRGSPGVVELPFVLPVVLYASIAAALYSVLLCIVNLTVNLKELKRVPGKMKIVYMFTALPLRARDLKNKRFWYPLERPWDKKKKFRSTFDVCEDDTIIRRKVESLIAHGALNENQKLWCTYGIPFIVYITIGYIATLLGGDKLLLSGITRLIK